MTKSRQLHDNQTSTQVRKRTYHTPQFENMGTVAELTQSGTPSTLEAGGFSGLLGA
jgi:hypothetical protein